MHPGIVAAIAAVGVFATMLGISYPLLALVLDRAGQSQSFIGLNAAMAPLGFFLSAPLIPWAATLINPVKLAIAATTATGFLMASFAAIADPYWWFVLRFLLGAAINVLFVLSETWINQLAPAQKRGRIMGIYITVLSIGFALGPLMVALVGTRGHVPFAIAFAGSLLAAPILYWARNHLPPFPKGGVGQLWTFTYAAPVLLVIAGTVALFDQTTLSLVPLYALRTGFDETAAAIATGTLIAGNVVSQIPIGLASERIPRRTMIAALVAIVILCSAMLPLLAGSVLFWPLLFIWGGTGYGIYTVALAELGARFSGSKLLAGNAAFSMMWGIGGLIGPPSAGMMMDFTGPDGLPLTLALIFAALAILIAFRPLVPGALRS